MSSQQLDFGAIRRCVGALQYWPSLLASLPTAATVYSCISPCWLPGPALCLPTPITMIGIIYMNLFGISSTYSWDVTFRWITHNSKHDSTVPAFAGVAIILQTLLNAKIMPWMCGSKLWQLTSLFKVSLLLFNFCNFFFNGLSAHKIILYKTSARQITHHPATQHLHSKAQ